MVLKVKFPVSAVVTKDRGVAKALSMQLYHHVLPTASSKVCDELFMGHCTLKEQCSDSSGGFSYPYPTLWPVTRPPQAKCSFPLCKLDDGKGPPLPRSTPASLDKPAPTDVSEL